MFGQPRSRDSNRGANGEASQPLLNRSRDNLAQDQVVFSVTDSDDELEESSALEAHKGESRDHNVRFQDDVQVIGPPLRSTMSSREAGVYVLLCQPEALLICY